MRTTTRPGRFLCALAALTATAGAVAIARADVAVYENDFGTRSEFREVAKSGGGKVCDRRHRKQSKALRATVKRGPTDCSFRIPVEGDQELPNHDLRVDGKVLASTAKSVRGAAYLAASVRSGGDGVGYTLRIFPDRKRFELHREPGGAGFPAEGRSDAIEKVHKRNRLQLVARGAVVTAYVNGEKLASATDENPAQVSGRKLRFGIGNRKDSAKDVVGTFKKLTVAVP